MSVNLFISAIKTLHRDGDALIESLTTGFQSEFGHFARSNNRQPLNDGCKILTKSTKDKAVATAVTVAFIKAGLVTGFVGAQAGKFRDQPDDIRSKFEDAIFTASEAFKASLIESGAFAAPVPKTDEEKAKAKANKAEKTQKGIDDAIVEKIKNGELVRAENVHELSVTAMVDIIVSHLEAGTLSADNRAELTAALTAALAPAALAPAALAPAALTAALAPAALTAALAPAALAPAALTAALAPAALTAALAPAALAPAALTAALAPAA